jgi:hypothetical protein
LRPLVYFDFQGAGVVFELRVEAGIFDGDGSLSGKDFQGFDAIARKGVGGEIVF